MCSGFSRWVSGEDTLRRTLLLGRGDGVVGTGGKGISW